MRLQPMPRLALRAARTRLNRRSVGPLYQPPQDGFPPKSSCHRNFMNLPKWLSWAGFSAMLGSSIAILLTAPFAIAYYKAYPGFDVPPFWIQPLNTVLTPLLAFSSPENVYNSYGRIFNFVYLLFLPAVFALHHLHRIANGKLEKVAYGILSISLPATFIGVAGDYWMNGAGFFIEVLGLLALNLGATLYGVVVLRNNLLPKWCGWLMASCFPGLFVFMFLIWHIPSAPTFLIAVSWLILGYIIFSGKGLQIQEQAAG
jgi:hypothetical protein